MARAASRPRVQQESSNQGGGWTYANQTRVAQPPGTGLSLPGGYGVPVVVVVVIVLVILALTGHLGGFPRLR